MPFTVEQFQQVQTALFNAFNRASLEQLVRIELDTNLNHVAGGQNETELVHNLIVWAIEERRLAELIEAAARQNSGNALVQRLVADAQGWYLSEEDASQFERVGASPKTVVEGDQYNVGDITNSEAVAIGRGAIANSIKNFFFGKKGDVIHQRNRQRMLNLVRSTWIEGVLEPSLDKEVLIELCIEYKPNMIENPWNTVIQEIGQAKKVIETGTRVIEVFDQLNQTVLILGQPGGGKTNLLLQLTRDLIERAEANYEEPIPVVFNLSSWANERRPINEWLVEELQTRYSIPKKVAQPWVDNDELLLLLDGLDEVVKQYRDECVEAVNAFLREHLVPLAVCSRVAEYESLTIQINIQDSILIQSLDEHQIYSYLEGVGLELQLGAVLQRDKNLLELADSPLMINVMARSYDGESVEDLTQTNTLEGHRSIIFDSYIRRMFKRRKDERAYTQEQTIKWLTWLASNMNQQQQTIFQIERLQPDWLQSPDRIRLYKVFIGLFGGLIGGLIGWEVFGWVFAVFGGLFGWLFGWQDSRIEVREILTLNFSLKNGLFGGLGGGLSVGLIAGLFVGLFVGLRDGLHDGLLVGLFVGLSVGLICVLVFELLVDSGAVEAKSRVQPNQGIWKLLENMLIIGLVIGLVIGADFGLELVADSGGVEALLRVQPNQSIWKLLENMLIFGLVVVMVVVMVAGAVFILACFWFGGVGAWLFGGVYTIIKHFVLRFLLWRYNLAPLNYARFLDYCHDRIFLRKVSGGYIFIHRMFMEHFANMTDEDIERIVNSLEQWRA